MSYFKRQHRWIPGRCSGLPFGHRWIEKHGKTKTKNRYLLSRYKIKDNIPPQPCSGFAQQFVDFRECFCPIGLQLLPPSVPVIIWFTRLYRRFLAAWHTARSLFSAFFSDVKPVISDIAINMIYSAFIVGLYFEINGGCDGHVLENACFASKYVRMGDSIWSGLPQKIERLQYIRSMWISIVFGAATLIFGLLCKMDLYIVDCFSVMVSALLSKGHLEKAGILPNQKRADKAYAKPMWQYFKTWPISKIITCRLTFSNFSPVEEGWWHEPHRPTSDYIWLSCLAARDFELHNSAELTWVYPIALKHSVCCQNGTGILYSGIIPGNLEVLGGYMFRPWTAETFSSFIGFSAGPLQIMSIQNPGFWKIESKFKRCWITLIFRSIQWKKTVVLLGSPSGCEADGEHYYDMYMRWGTRHQLFRDCTPGDCAKVHWGKLSRPIGFGYPRSRGLQRRAGTSSNVYGNAELPGSAAWILCCLQLRCSSDYKVKPFRKVKGGFFAFRQWNINKYPGIRRARLALKQGNGEQNNVVLMLLAKPRMSLVESLFWGRSNRKIRFFTGSTWPTEERVETAVFHCNKLYGTSFGYEFNCIAPMHILKNIFNKRFTKRCALA